MGRRGKGEGGGPENGNGPKEAAAVDWAKNEEKKREGRKQLFQNSLGFGEILMGLNGFEFKPRQCKSTKKIMQRHGCSIKLLL